MDQNPQVTGGLASLFSRAGFGLETPPLPPTFYFFALPKVATLPLVRFSQSFSAKDLLVSVLCSLDCFVSFR